MKRLIASSILSAGALFGLSTEAEAARTDSLTGWPGRGATTLWASDACRSSPGIVHTGGRYRDHRSRGLHGSSNRRVYDHRRVCYERIWVPACYRNVIVGYDACGHPIYRKVMVHAGYWRTVRRHGH